VYTRFVIRTGSITLGIALLTAGLFFDGGIASSFDQQPQATPVNTLSPFERLEKPTLPPEPSQADLGAQDYWLYCLPCHGDRGQGLTDEFRQTYPPEEQYCWESGCHGKRPYENGFALPMNIAAVIGPGALQKFPTAAHLRGFIFTAMPFWKPGSLTEEESWRVTAFLLRENGLWQGTADLDSSNASSLQIARGTPTPEAVSQRSNIQNRTELMRWIVIIVVILLISVLIFTLKKIQNATKI
jgi:hypothetical protein